MSSIYNNLRASVLFFMIVSAASTTCGWQGWTTWAGNGFDAAKKSLVLQKQAITENISSAATYGYRVIGSVNTSCRHAINYIKKTAKAYPYEAYLIVGVMLGVCVALRWNRKKRAA